jgi:hypothetical protein
VRACVVCATLAGFGISRPRDVAAQSICNPDGGSTPSQSIGSVTDVFPGDREVNVPIDGVVRLRYLGRAPRRAFVAVIEAPMNQDLGPAVPGTATVVGNEVIWRANAPLRPNTHYVIRAADDSQTTTDSGFTTGVATAPAEAVHFDGITLVSATTGRRTGEPDLCGDPDAAQVSVSFRRAESVWPHNDIEYVIYEVRGPGIAGPVERARVRRGALGSSSATEISTTFRLASADASGPVCFNIQAVDPFGREDGNPIEKCTNPAVGNYFAGCSAARLDASAGGREWRMFAVFAVAAVAAAGARRVRSRR